MMARIGSYFPEVGDQCWAAAEEYKRMALAHVLSEHADGRASALDVVMIAAELGPIGTPPIVLASPLGSTRCAVG